MTRFLSYEFPQEDNTRRHVIPMDITELDRSTSRDQVSTNAKRLLYHVMYLTAVGII